MIPIIISGIVINQIFPVTNTFAGTTYHTVADTPPDSATKKGKPKISTVFDIWKHQFVDAVTVKIFNLPSVF